MTVRADLVPAVLIDRRLRQSPLLVLRHSRSPDRQADDGDDDPEQRVHEHAHQIAVLVLGDAKPIRYPVAWRDEYPKYELAEFAHLSK